MERWPGAVESGRAIALQVLRWLAEALLLALVTGTMALVLSQVVSLWKPLLRLPLGLVLTVCVLTLAALWLAGRERALRAVRGSLWFMAVMAAAAVVVGVAVWGLGQYLSDRREPVTLKGLWAGFAIGAVVIWTVLTAATWLAWRRYTGTASKRFAALAVLALISLAVGFLTARAPRWELDREGQEIRARGLGRIDVLLVIDPHDAAGRRLIAEAGDQREELRARPPTDTARFDIAFGLAVLSRPRDPPAPLYRTVLSPGARATFVDALAGLAPAEGPPAFGSYGRVLFDAVESAGEASFQGTDAGVRWRPASRRAVVFVASRPPSEKELAEPPGASEPLGFRPAEPVGFSTALMAHQSSILAGAGALATGPQSSLGVYMVAPGAGPSGRDWNRWTQASGGRVIDPGAYERPTVLRAIEDALTDSPVASARRLAERYRPHLSLAREERTRPVDVEALLRQAPREPADRVCDRRRLARDDCVGIPSAPGLLRGPDGGLREQDEYIDFEEDVREAFHGTGPRVATRIYFHMRRHDGLLHIGYWWFFPVNISPVQVNETCLPGLTLRELTCYDHEGDWEGVTVTLEPRSPETTPSGDPYNPASFDPRGWRARSVTYDAHGRGIRWPWGRLRGTLALDDSTHPVVFAARGSHASYPLPCAKDCNQRLARTGLPEGPFDGNEDTRIRCEELCLKPMPSLRRQSPFTRPVERDEDPVLWNAFPGRWGAAVCLPVAQVCSQSDGPRTPSRQDRYRRPWAALEPGRAAVREFERRRAAGARR